MPTMTSFADLTIDSAPPAARRGMVAVRDHLGYLPSATARMAASPHLLDAFNKANALFEGCTLDPLAREVVVMTMAVRNGCHLCVAMHTGRLTKLGADTDLIISLRVGRPLADERLDAVRTFTVRVIDTAGDVGDEALRALVAAGFSTQNALEIVLGVGTYTLSTLANRLTRAPLDEPMRAFA